MTIRSILPIFICLLTVVFAKDYRFEHLTIEDGLSENSVLSIYQDSRGFLWFGTIGGLNRYDGYNFKIFKNNANDSSSIGGNYIVVITEDNDNNLWIGTYQGGLNRFVRDNETFIRYGNGEKQRKGLSDNSAISIFHDSHDRFWVGTIKGGINLLNRETGAAHVFNYDPKSVYGISGTIINSITEDSNGNIWIGSSFNSPSGNIHSLNRLDSLNIFSQDSAYATFTRFYEHPQDQSNSINSSISTLLQDPTDKGILWAATRDAGIGKFDIASGRFSWLQHNPQVKTSISNNRVYNMFFDGNNRLWACTFGGGLNLLNRKNNTFQNFRNNPAVSSSISDDKVIFATEDLSGNIWIGTHKAGLNKLNPKANQFRHYGAATGESGQLSSSFISSIYESKDGHLWIGTQSGLNRFSPDQKSNQIWKHNPSVSSTLGNDWVYAIEEDNRGNFWIGSYGGGLNLMDRKTGRFTRFLNEPNNPNSLRDNDVISLKSSGDYLWIGTQGGGLNRLNLDDFSFKHYSYDPKALTQISNNTVRDIEIDNEGIIWLATTGGLNRFDPMTEEFEHFIHDPQNLSSISNDLVITLLEYSDTEIWVGTINGLNRFDKKTQTFRRQQNLPNEVIHTILKDKNDTIWITTNGGICKYLPESDSFRNYTTEDGLLANEFNQNVALLGKDGQLFAGGPMGLISFYPDSLKDNTNKPLVVLTNFLLFNEPVGVTTKETPSPLNKTISELDELILSWEDKVFSFEFAGLDYTRPEKNDYAYMMEGFDESWIPAGERKFATYTNLDPGTYTFRVKASNNHGIWNTEGSSLRLTIQPPYWETWWFRLLVLLGIILIPLLIYRNRVLNLLALERLRVRIASDLHDDIGGTLNAIVMQTEILKSGIDEEKIPEKLDRISDMGRDATRMLSDVVWSIDARNDSFGDLIDHIKDFADLTLGKKEIRIDYKISGIDLKKPLDINVRQNLYLISKEALSNIAKYANASIVQFDMINQQDSFTLRIRDNGTGLAENSRRSGHGLRNMDLRAERLNGKVSFNDSDGFTVLFTGPTL